MLLISYYAEVYYVALNVEACLKNETSDTL